MITKEDIEKLAALARINITDEEKESMRGDIERILEYVKFVNKFHSDGTPEESDQEKHPPLYNVMRDDVVTHQSGEFTEDLLALAPSRQGNYLKVKKIL